MPSASELIYGLNVGREARGADDLARAYAYEEAQKNRNFATQQQQADLSGRRQLAEDQYGYSLGLQGQQNQFTAYRDFNNYAHEDDLFEKHRAGALAEMQLQQLQQKKMAQFEAANQEQRDYRQGDIQSQYLGQQQDFQSQQAQEGYSQQEQRDYRMQGFDQERLGQQQEFDAAKIGFDAYQQQQKQYNDLMNTAVLQKMAAGRFEAEQKIIHALDNDTLSTKNRYAANLIKQQAIEEQDKEIHRGLSTGDYILPEGGEKEIRANNEYLLRIMKSPYVSEEERQDLQQQIMQQNTMVRRLSTQIPPEQKAASVESRRLAYIQTHGLTPDEAKFVTVNDKGQMIYDPHAVAYALGLKKQQQDMEKAVLQGKQKSELADKQGQQKVDLADKKSDVSKEIATMRMDFLEKQAKTKMDYAQGLIDLSRNTMSAPQWETARRQLQGDLDRHAESVFQEVESEELTEEVPALFGLYDKTVPMTAANKMAEVKRRLEAKGFKNNLGNSYEEYLQMRKSAQGGNAEGKGTVKKRFRYDPNNVSLSPVE